jgi:hypothetical protein
MNNQESDLKDFFKNRINEALKGNRQKLTFMGKARGVDPNTFQPVPTDPRNRALMRSALRKAAKGDYSDLGARGNALSNAGETLMRTEFGLSRGGTDPVYEAVKKLDKKKGKAGGTDATY